MTRGGVEGNKNTVTGGVHRKHCPADRSQDCPRIKLHVLAEKAKKNNSLKFSSSDSINKFKPACLENWVDIDVKLVWVSKIELNLSLNISLNIDSDRQSTHAP